MYICDLYGLEPERYCQRYRNNSEPGFTGQERNHMPWPFTGRKRPLHFIPVPDNALTVFKQAWCGKITGRIISGDKMYAGSGRFSGQEKIFLLNTYIRQ